MAGYLSSTTRARVAIACLLLRPAAELLRFAEQYILFRMLRAGGPEVLADPTVRAGMLLGAFLRSSLPCALAFLAWIYAVVRNARTLGGETFRHRPLVAVAVWPLVGLRVLRDVERAASPSGAQPHRVILLWWVMLWAGLIGEAVWRLAVAAIPWTEGQFPWPLVTNVVVVVTELVALGLTVWVILQVERMMRGRAAERDALVEVFR